MAHVRCSIIGFIAVLCCMFGPGTAAAGIPGYFTAKADETGVEISYLLPALGAKMVVVTPDQPATVDLRLMGSPLADVTLSMTGVSETPPGVMLHYLVESQFIPAAEGDVTVPYGEVGAQLNFFGVLPMLPGNGDIEVTLLLQKNRATYYVAADLPAFSLDEPWLGTATPANNQIEKQIAVQTAEGAATADVTVAFSWDTPGMTSISFEITLTPDLPEGLPPGFDNETLMPPIQGGPIPVPNGSYRLWFKRNVK